MSAVSHSCATITGQNRNNRCFESMNIVGFVSGKPGVSAMINGAPHLPVRLLWRAASITTSSAVRSPDPWNQQTSRSPFGNSTIEEEWLCHFSGGKISSLSYKGCAAAATANRNAIRTRIVNNVS
jgi:hypothetical protein